MNVGVEHFKAAFAIGLSLKRQQYCTDAVHGRSNAAAYALRDALRVEGILGEEHDILRFEFRKDMRIALQTWGIDYHQIPVLLRLTEMVAQSYEVKPMGATHTFLIDRDFRPEEMPSFLQRREFRLPPFILFVPRDSSAQVIA